MNHAWLIITHGEFEILKLLVEGLDYANNDIYIHFDKKVKHIPKIKTINSRLFILKNRIDVRWGHVSQIKTELLLFKEAAKNGPYSYYHLISGVHLPLKPMQMIQDYFKSINGYSALSDFEEPDSYEVNLKMRRYNCFLKNFASHNQFIKESSQFLWKAAIALQRVFRITRNDSRVYYKARNWVSLTEEAVLFILSREKQILHDYRFSFCGDEFFVPSLLMDSPLKNRIIASDCLLLCQMIQANAKCFPLSERQTLADSKFLFARKFTSKSE